VFFSVPPAPFSPAPQLPDRRLPHVFFLPFLFPTHSHSAAREGLGTFHFLISNLAIIPPPYGGSDIVFYLLPPPLEATRSTTVPTRLLHSPCRIHRRSKPYDCKKVGICMVPFSSLRSSVQEDRFLPPHCFQYTSPLVIAVQLKEGISPSIFSLLSPPPYPIFPSRRAE